VPVPPPSEVELGDPCLNLFNTSVNVCWWPCYGGDVGPFLIQIELTTQKSADVSFPVTPLTSRLVTLYLLKEMSFDSPVSE